jgi:hypothetical protein
LNAPTASEVPVKRTARWDIFTRILLRPRTKERHLLATISASLASPRPPGAGCRCHLRTRLRRHLASFACWLGLSLVRTDECGERSIQPGQLPLHAVAFLLQLLNDSGPLHDLIPLDGGITPPSQARSFGKPNTPEASTDGTRTRCTVLLPLVFPESIHKPVFCSIGQRVRPTRYYEDAG